MSKLSEHVYIIILSIIFLIFIFIHIISDLSLYTYSLEFVFLCFLIFCLGFLLAKKVDYMVFLIPVALTFPIAAEYGDFHINVADLVVITIFYLWLIKKFQTRNKIQVYYLYFAPSLIYILLSTLSLLYVKNLTTSIIRVIESIEIFILVPLLIFDTIKEKKQVMIMFYSIIFSSFAGAVYIILQSIYGFPGLEHSMLKVTKLGGFVGPTIGAYFGCSILISLCLMMISRKLRIKFIYLFLLPVVALGMSFTLYRTWIIVTMLVMIIGYFLFFYLRSSLKYLKVIGSVFLVLAVILLIAYSTFLREDTLLSKNREISYISKLVKFKELYTSEFLRSRAMNKWEAAMSQFFNFPILGVGIVNIYLKEIQALREEGRKAPDNFYIQVLLESGILGFLCISFILMYSFLSAFKFYVKTRISNVEWKIVSVALFCSILIWFLGGINWNLLGSGKSGMMFFLFLSLAISAGKIFIKSEHEINQLVRNNYFETK